MGPVSFQWVCVNRRLPDPPPRMDSYLSPRRLSPLRANQRHIYLSRNILGISIHSQARLSPRSHLTVGAIDAGEAWPPPFGFYNVEIGVLGELNNAKEQRS